MCVKNAAYKDNCPKDTRRDSPYVNIEMRKQEQGVCGEDPQL